MGTLGGTLLPLPPSGWPRCRALPHKKFLVGATARNAGKIETRVRSQSSRQESGTTEEPAGNSLPLEAQSQSPAEAGDGADNRAQSQEEQQQIGEALKELRKSSPSSPGSVGFWDGLAQEIGMIEWPNPGKVFGTTLVVLAIIFGSSIVLLTVNFLLAELSDVVFKVQ